jgi:hypothetical protein
MTFLGKHELRLWDDMPDHQAPGDHETVGD